MSTDKLPTGAVTVKMLFEADKPKPGTGGRPLDIHPLIVLVVTALGGVIGGIAGLILAVPFFAIARNAIAQLRSRDVAELVADRAKPAVRRILE